MFSFHRTVRSNEYGLTNRMFECIVKSAKSVVRNNEFSLFANLKSYIEEFSGSFSNLILENFRYIFIYYFLFILLAFAVCVGHRVLVIVAKMTTRRKNRRLKHFVRNRPLGSQIKKIAVRKTNDFYRLPVVSSRTNHLVSGSKCLKRVNLKLLF